MLPLIWVLFRIFGFELSFFVGSGRTPSMQRAHKHGFSALVVTRTVWLRLKHSGNAPRHSGKVPRHSGEVPRHSGLEPESNLLFIACLFIKPSITLSCHLPYTNQRSRNRPSRWNPSFSKSARLPAFSVSTSASMRCRFSVLNAKSMTATFWRPNIFPNEKRVCLARFFLWTTNMLHNRWTSWEIEKNWRVLMW